MVKFCNDWSSRLIIQNARIGWPRWLEVNLIAIWFGKPHGKIYHGKRRLLWNVAVNAIYRHLLWYTTNLVILHPPQQMLAPASCHILLPISLYGVLWQTFKNVHLPLEKSYKNWVLLTTVKKCIFGKGHKSFMSCDSNWPIKSWLQQIIRARYKRFVTPPRKYLSLIASKTLY